MTITSGQILFSSASFSRGSFDWLRWKILDLLYQKCLLILKLLVVCSLRKKVGQETQQLFSIVDEDLLDREGFVRVGDKNLVIVSLHSCAYPIEAREPTLKT